MSWTVEAHNTLVGAERPGPEEEPRGSRERQKWRSAALGMGMSEHRAETLSQEPHRLASETAERIDVHREAGTYVEIAEIT